MLNCDVFLFLVKSGVPSDEDLDWLSLKLDKFNTVGRRLKVEEVILAELDNENRKLSEKLYQMLLHWKESRSFAATYTVLHDALCHPLVNRRDLAEEVCCQKLD